MEDKKSSSKMEKLDSENRKGSTSSEKLSSAGGLDVKEAKKLDEFRDSDENKKAIAESEGKIVENKNEPQITSTQGAPSASGKMNADSGKGEKKSKKEKKKGEVVELDREYVVPLKRGVLNVPRYRRAKKAVRVLKEFMVRHMGIRDGDLGKVKIDMYLNNEIWFRGIKKPMNKVKVRAKKIGGIVYVSLAEEPEVVSFAKAREMRAKREAEGRRKKDEGAKRPKAGKKVEDKDKDKDGVDDKKEEAEDKKAGAEKAAKVAKVKAGVEKHTAQGKHGKKVQPVRKALKK